MRFSFPLPSPHPLKHLLPTYPDHTKVWIKYLNFWLQYLRETTSNPLWHRRYVCTRVLNSKQGVFCHFLSGSPENNKFIFLFSYTVFTEQIYTPKFLSSSVCHGKMIVYISNNDLTYRLGVWFSSLYLCGNIFTPGVSPKLKWLYAIV